MRTRVGLPRLGTAMIIFAAPNLEEPFGGDDAFRRGRVERGAALIAAASHCPEFQSLAQAVPFRLVCADDHNIFAVRLQLDGLIEQCFLLDAVRTLDTCIFLQLGQEFLERYTPDRDFCEQRTEYFLVHLRHFGTWVERGQDYALLLEAHVDHAVGHQLFAPFFRDFHPEVPVYHVPGSLVDEDVAHPAHFLQGTGHHLFLFHRVSAPIFRVFEEFLRGDRSGTDNAVAQRGACGVFRCCGFLLGRRGRYHFRNSLIIRAFPQGEKTKRNDPKKLAYLVGGRGRRHPRSARRHQRTRRISRLPIPGEPGAT